MKERRALQEGEGGGGGGEAAELAPDTHFAYWFTVELYFSSSRATNDAMNRLEQATEQEFNSVFSQELLEASREFDQDGVGFGRVDVNEAGVARVDEDGSGLADAAAGALSVRVCTRVRVCVVQVISLALFFDWLLVGIIV